MADKLARIRQWVNTPKPAFEKNDNVICFGLVGILAASVGVGSMIGYIQNIPKPPEGDQSLLQDDASDDEASPREVAVREPAPREATEHRRRREHQRLNDDSDDG